MDLSHLVAADMGVADVAFSLAHSRHALFYSALNCPALPCHALPCPALSCPVLPYPEWLCPDIHCPAQCPPPLPCPVLISPINPDWLQGASSGLVVNSHALPGKVPEKLEIDIEGDVLPAQLAAEHAAKYPDNVHPVSPLNDPCPGTQHDLALVTWLHRTHAVAHSHQ